VLSLTKTKNGKWYKKIFTVTEERQVKKKMKRSPKRFFKRLKARLFGTKRQVLRQIQNLIVIGVIVLIYILYGYGIWFDSFSAFWTTTIVSGVRILAYLVSKYGEEELWNRYRRMGDSVLAKKITIVILHILLWVSITMGANLIYGYNIFWRMGLVETWINEMTYTSYVLLFFIALVGINYTYLTRDALKDETYLLQKRRFRDGGEVFQYRLRWFFMFIGTVITPIVMMLFLSPFLARIDQSLYNGYISTIQFTENGGYEAQAGGAGFTTYFGLVFYILFQQPIPMFMVAFMTFATIAVLMAQSQDRVGRLAVGVAVAVSAIIPLIFVIMALTSAIPPPTELTSAPISLDPAIAGFVYGLGLILTYIIAITIMGVFVSSSRILIGTWQPR
jgi:hypothetical protein